MSDGLSIFSSFISLSIESDSIALFSSRIVLSCHVINCWSDIASGLAALYSIKDPFSGVIFISISIRPLPPFIEHEPVP